jgi:FkbM family methyltransferase
MEQEVQRRLIGRLWLKLIRFYTFHAPLQKGKSRLYQVALKLCRYPPTRIETKIRDGRWFDVNLADKMHHSVFFLGEYERAVTDVISTIVRRSDVCMDIGANFGWYMTLLGKLCSDGEVHAFEPLPDVFDRLKQNWKLAGEPENVYLNNLALGDETKTIEIHRFTNLPSGFSSFSTHCYSDYQSLSVPMTTLNSYLIEKKIGDIDFIKIDVEGAELMLLQGAIKLFEQKTPPIIMAEMALGTTKGFGYLPNDLIKFIGQRAAYEFYALNDYNGTLRRITEFKPFDIGANVLCFPKNGEFERLQNLKIIE